MLMNFSLLQKGELVMIRRAIDRDASRIAEISVFSKRMNYREIFHDDMVSFGEIQVYPLAKEYIEHPEILKEFYVYEDDFVKGFIHIQGTQVLELYVDTFFVDQGIGGKLLDFAVSRNCNSLCFDTYCNLYWCNFTDICRTGKCMGTDIDDDFLHPVCDNIIPFSLLGRDVYLLIYVTSDVCLVDCDMAEKCEKQ